MLAHSPSMYIHGFYVKLNGLLKLRLLFSRERATTIVSVQNIKLGNIQLIFICPSCQSNFCGNIQKVLSYSFTFTSSSSYPYLLITHTRQPGLDLDLDRIIWRFQWTLTESGFTGVSIHNKERNSDSWQSVLGYIISYMQFCRQP